MALLPVVNNIVKKEGRMSAREIEKMKKLTSFYLFRELMITINGGQLELLYLILEPVRDCEDEALEAWKMFSSQVQSMMKVDVI